LPNSLNDVMEILADWPIQKDLAALVKHIPQEQVIHHSIALRDPLKTWISTGGRTIVIGDAAHSYLPILGQGGSQAVEDAAVLAITLELSGKSNVRLALQAAEKIRCVCVWDFFFAPVLLSKRLFIDNLSFYLLVGSLVLQGSRKQAWPCIMSGTTRTGMP
jgi:hypothetical protein